jgi:hypothetical protein
MVFVVVMQLLMSVVNVVEMGVHAKKLSQFHLER